VLGGYIFLKEKLSTAELAGCAIIFAAVVIAQLPQKKVTASAE
jgi:drug/metabolite transporter (DMT)-like permease